MLRTVSPLPGKATVYETSQRQTSQHIQFLHETTKSLLKLGTARKADSSMTYIKHCKVQNSWKKVMLLSFQNAWLNVGITLICRYTCSTLILEYITGVFTEGKPWLQTCPVMLSSLLQESQFCPLPGRAQPTNACVCVYMWGLHVCLQGRGATSFSQYVHSFSYVLVG